MIYIYRCEHLVQIKFKPFEMYGDGMERSTERMIKKRGKKIGKIENFRKKTGHSV